MFSQAVLSGKTLSALLATQNFTSEGNLIGNVDGVDENSVFVLKVAEQIIRYLNILLKGYDGHEVTLNVQKTELERYEDAAGEGFRKVK